MHQDNQHYAYDIEGVPALGRMIRQNESRFYLLVAEGYAARIEAWAVQKQVTLSGPVVGLDGVVRNQTVRARFSEHGYSTGEFLCTFLLPRVEARDP